MNSNFTWTQIAKRFLLTVYLLCWLIPQTCYSQTYQFDGNSVIVRESERPLILQFYVRTLDLGKLYSYTKWELANEFGITAQFDDQLYGANGEVEVRIYDLEDETKTKGNQIYGAKAVPTTKPNGLGLRCESWDVSSGYKHWENWNKHFVKSTDIKFLSQKEKVGSVCDSPPASYYQYPRFYAGLALSAVGLGEAVFGVATLDVPVLLAGAVQVFMGGYMAYSAEQDASKLDKEFKTKVSQWALKYQNEVTGEWCNISSPFPGVLVELEISNAKVESVSVPGLGVIYPSMLLPAEQFVLDVQEINMESAPIANLTQMLGSNLVFRPSQGTPGFPLPDHLVLPQAPGYAGTVSLSVPDNGRLLLVSTEESMHIFSMTMDAQQKKYTLQKVAANPFIQTAKKEYYMYSLVLAPQPLTISAGEGGPFLAGYEFNMNTKRSTEEARQSNSQNQFDNVNATIESNELPIVSPNPFTKSFDVRFHLNRSSSVEVSIKDAKGQAILQQVHQLQAGPQLLSIESDSFQSGLYILTISSSTSVFTSKIVKQ